MSLELGWGGAGAAEVAGWGSVGGGWDSGGVDLSPGYREFAPPEWLRETLACLWVGVTEPGGEQTTLVLPDAAVDLIWQQGGDCFLAGPDTGPAPVSAPGGAVTVGVRFRPGAGGTVLGLPLSEVLDQRVSARDLGVLRGRVPAGGLEPQRALAALAALVTELAQQRPADPAMTGAARLLARPGSRAEAVAQVVDLSERQFRRRLQASVGYGPRMLHRVLRFRRFVSALDAGGLPGGLAGAAVAAGYADQPHLTRECVEMSGLTPQALSRVRGPAAARAGAAS
jgi:AraC-like DNA-binding protein